MLVINEDFIFIALLIMVVCGIFFCIRCVFRLVKWFFCTVWGFLTGQRIQKCKKRSNDWLTNAQDRMEIRFMNAAPPLLSDAKPQKKTFMEKRNEKKGLSPTGWRFNEETQLWEGPEKRK